MLESGKNDSWNIFELGKYGISKVLFIILYLSVYKSIPLERQSSLRSRSRFVVVYIPRK